MGMNVQAKLLRALEERAVERLGGNETIPVDVRFVSATHRDLEEEISENRFRADLFYRLRVVTIEVPPLRERREDIAFLAQQFAKVAAERYNLQFRPVSQEALRVLIDYDWPGNVRELRNSIERAAIMAEGIEVRALDLPDDVTRKPQAAREFSGEAAPSELLVPFTADFRADRKEFERRYITRCLDETSGNVTKAATILGMHRQSLQHKLRELGMGRRYVAVDGEMQE
jgi:DNA-binding NtrC family response regulator